LKRHDNRVPRHFKGQQADFSVQQASKRLQTKLKVLSAKGKKVELKVLSTSPEVDETIITITYVLSNS